MRVLCINAGSSSLKFALYDADADSESLQFRGAVEENGLAAVHAMFGMLDARALPRPDAVGHRLVHGGPNHLSPVGVDGAVLEALRAAVPFAPLHLPAEIEGIEAVARRNPDLPQVACFDTAFHRTLPDVAQRFPLPQALAARGVRRYGFHGLSYEYVVEHLGAASLGRAVIAHLGNGASLVAVRDGVSVDTTMGFTPAGGVMMGTRTGDLDPGLLVYLLDHGYDARSLERLITRASGLLGVSAISADVRTLLERRERDADAAFALALFAQQVRKAIGALTAVLGGMDSLVFTGGIGEHAAPVRAEICAGLAHLGVVLDEEGNRMSSDRIEKRGSPVAVHVVHTDEERMIARHTQRVLAT